MTRSKTNYKQLFSLNHRLALILLPMLLAACNIQINTGDLDFLYGSKQATPTPFPSASASGLTGSPDPTPASETGNQLVINSVQIDSQPLSVGAQTQIRIQASTIPSRTIRYTVRAERGLILTGDPTIDQNPNTSVQSERETFTYVAPFTSRYPDDLGNMLQGDTLTILAEDGTSSAQVTQTINLSGDTMVYVKETDELSELWAATVGEGGYGVTNHRQLRDRNKLPLRGSSPAIAPNGRQIAFVYYPGTGSSAIYTLDPAGFVLNITGDQGRNVDPSWAPNSRELVFASDRDDNNYDIYLINAERDGNMPQRLTSTRVDERYPAYNPSLHPDRRSTLAVSVKSTERQPVSQNADTWNLYIYDLATRTYRSKLTQRADLGQFALEPKWRSDGVFLAYTRKGPINHNTSGGTDLQRIYVLDTSRSSEGHVLNINQIGTNVAESSPIWSPNGSEIAYLQTVNGTSGTVYRQLVNPQSSTSEFPRIWQDFSTPVPALVFDTTMNQPRFTANGLSLDWR